MRDDFDTATGILLGVALSAVLWLAGALVVLLMW